MPLLPSDRFVFDSPLSPDEAAERLGGLVEPTRMFRLMRGPLTRPFEGEVAPRIFRIRRVVLGRRKAFAPQIHGTMRRVAHGSRIEGTMSLHPLTRAFLSTYLGFAVFFIFVFSAVALRDGSGAALVLMPCVLFLFAWAMTKITFTEETRAARRLLADGLAATSAEPNPVAERPR